MVDQPRGGKLTERLRALAEQGAGEDDAPPRDDEPAGDIASPIFVPGRGRVEEAAVDIVRRPDGVMPPVPGDLNAAMDNVQAAARRLMTETGADPAPEIPPQDRAAPTFADTPPLHIDEARRIETPPPGIFERAYVALSQQTRGTPTPTADKLTAALYFGFAAAGLAITAGTSQGRQAFSNVMRLILQ